VIVSLGYFPFKAKSITNLEEQLEAHFGEFDPILSNPRFHNTQGVKETKTISGVYIADSNSKVEVLKQTIKDKKVVRLTFATGISAKVIATSFTTNKKNFLPFAGAVNIDFQINIIVVEEDFNIIGALYGLL